MTSPALDRAIVGGRIREARDCRGFSRLQLGEMLGVSPRIVESWEQGRRLPRTHELPALKAALGVSLDDLLDAAPARPIRRPRGRPRE